MFKNLKTLMSLTLQAAVLVSCFLSVAYGQERLAAEKFSADKTYSFGERFELLISGETPIRGRIDRIDAEGIFYSWATRTADSSTVVGFHDLRIPGTWEQLPSDGHDLRLRLRYGNGKFINMPPFSLNSAGKVVYSGKLSDHIQVHVPGKIALLAEENSSGLTLAYKLEDANRELSAQAFTFSVTLPEASELFPAAALEWNQIHLRFKNGEVITLGGRGFSHTGEYTFIYGFDPAQGSPYGMPVTKLFIAHKLVSRSPNDEIVVAGVTSYGQAQNVRIDACLADPTSIYCQNKPKYNPPLVRLTKGGLGIGVSW